MSSLVLKLAIISFAVVSAWQVQNVTSTGDQPTGAQSEPVQLASGSDFTAATTPALQFRIVPVRTLPLAFGEAGVVRELEHPVGTIVEAGDVIARLHAPQLGISVETAEMQYLEAERLYRRARARELGGRGSRLERQSAEAAYLVAKDVLKAANDRYAGTEIVAPVRGAVAGLLVPAYTTAAAQQPVISFADYSKTVVEINLGNMSAPDVAVLAQCQFTLRDAAGAQSLDLTFSELQQTGGMQDAVFLLYLSSEQPLAAPAIGPGQFEGITIEVSSAPQGGECAEAAPAMEADQMSHAQNSSARLTIPAKSLN